MFCSQCGTQATAGSRFCSSCGNSFGAGGDDVTQSQPVPAYPPPPAGGAVPPPPVGPGLAPPPPGSPPPPPGRSHRVAIEITAVVVVIVALLAVIGVLVFGGGKDDTDTAGTSTDSAVDSSMESFDDSGSSDSGGSNGRRSTTTTSTTTAPTTAPTTLDPVATARRDDASGYAFMQRLETMLARANNGRSEIGPLIAAVQDNCSRDPNDAVVAVNSVVTNRQGLLDEVASTGLVPGTFQVDLATKFQKAMSTSIEADRAYARWLENVRIYYYRPPQGCFGNPPTDSNWDDAQAAEAQVTPAKADFINAYNAQATRFGMKTWTVNDI